MPSPKEEERPSGLSPYTLLGPKALGSVIDFTLCCCVPGYAFYAISVSLWLDPKDKKEHSGF